MTKTKLPNLKSNVSRFPTTYSISSDYTDEEATAAARHNSKSSSAADKFRQANHSNVNAFKERVVTAVPRDINSSRVTIKDNTTSSHSSKTKPLSQTSHRTGSNTYEKVFETNNFHPNPTTFEESRHESRPSRVHSTKYYPSSSFEKYLQPFLRPAESNLPNKQLKAEPFSGTITSERNNYDNVFSKQFHFEQNRNLVINQPKSIFASQLDQNMQPEVAIRSPNRPALNPENRSEKQQVSTDQDCCLTPCCAGLYDLMIRCVNICDSDQG